MDQGGSQLSYVLITPARNEEAFIEKTIESMIHQTFLPLKWVIVDDASTDKTPEIISRYLARHPWMEMVQMPHGEIVALPPRCTRSTLAMKESKISNMKSSATWMPTSPLTGHFGVSCGKIRRGFYPGCGRNGIQRRRLQLGNGQLRRAEARFRAVSVVSQEMLRGNWRLHSTPGGGNRLDGGDYSQNEGLEDEIISREVLLPPSTLWERPSAVSSPHRSPTVRKTTTSAATPSGNSSG